MSQPSVPNASTTHCVILARGGSKGVPGKNLRMVGGLSLVARSVRAARAAPSVAQVHVSTDDAAIAAEARRFGAEVIDRPAMLSGDTASSESGWLHALEMIEERGKTVERLVFLQCTSPFTTGADIEACLAAMEEKGAACALSVIEDHSFLWTLDEAGLGRGTNHDESQPRKRRQDLPPAFRESGAIYCVRAADFVRTGQRFCGPVALCPVDHPPIEIDTPDDLALCSQIAVSHGGGRDIGDRLDRIAAVVMDFDGVHTDNLVLTDDTGREAVMTSRGDGMGLELLRKAGHWRLMILSKERNPVVERRAAKLNIEVYQSIDDKVAALEGWLTGQGLDWAQTLYVGNDVNDAAVMARAGLSACPADAHPEILARADWVLPQPGGRGALRAMCDALLARVS
ncbi:acylneuraminate cytidylyltransferase [Aquicoccus porphyridii]|uniref:acylneuraminate cytidylyltransferase n=1 Tax=Aquicoccus porphyridii TaxID=1852029 RepID=UPI00273ECB41|nr:acylneuraminate cytidylyltransferase [Aquicoccus porphyridii]